MIVNVGSNSSTIVQFFIRDQAGKIVCLSPVIGTVPSCSTALVSSTNVNVLPSTFSMGIGANDNLTTGYASNNAALTSCSVTAICSIGLVTQIGNVFVGSFPGANANGVSITTALNASTIAPGHHTMDTALLSGQTSNAGGSVTYSWFSDATCGALGGSKTSLAPVTVTNGVVPNSPIIAFPSASYYSYQAVYSGDANNSPATSACEPLSVVTGINACDPNTSICLATAAQGLGSLAFDFNSYKWYTSLGCAPQGTTPFALIGQAPKNSCAVVDGFATAGTATIGTATTLTDISKAWTVNAYSGYTVRILSGTGAGQTRTISSNTATVLTVSAAWATIPTATSVYAVYLPFSVKNSQIAYTISQTSLTNVGTNLFFSINVTNVDLQKRDIVIDQYTQLWFSYFCPTLENANPACGSGNHGGIATTYYGLVNMTSPYFAGGKPTESSPSLTALPSVTLKYAQTVTLFFGLQDASASVGGALPGIPLCGLSGTVPFTSQITPAFLFFHGSIGGTQWGLDFPLATTLWTNIGATC